MRDLKNHKIDLSNRLKNIIVTFFSFALFFWSQFPQEL